jgi:hypothetical protein
VASASAHGILRSLRAVALNALLGSLAACGGTQSAPVVDHAQLAGYAYIAAADIQDGQMPGAVYQYTIGPDGSLAPMTVASVPTGAGPSAMVADPTGRYVYVANMLDGSISQYTVGAGGALSALDPVTGAFVGLFPSLSVDPTGHYLYAVSITPDPPGPNTTISQYSIQSDGTLMALAPPSVSAHPKASGPLAIDPSGQFAYLPGVDFTTGGTVSQFSIQGDGTLVPLVPATVASTQSATGVAVAPGGGTAYVLSACVDTACNGQVEEYLIGGDGALTPTGTITPTGSHINPVAMLIDGTNASAYLLTNLMGVDTNVGSVYQYGIASTGALIPDSPASFGVASGAVDLRTDGHNVYALSANAVGFASGSPPGGHVDHYVIGTGGRLTVVSTMPLMVNRPSAMALVVTH